MRARTKLDHCVLCSFQDHLRTGMCDLDHPILARAENTDSQGLVPQVLWATGYGLKFWM
jgi:hypothetical protein